MSTSNFLVVKFAKFAICLNRLVYQQRLARVLIYSSFDSLQAVIGTCDQQRLCSECADAEADLSLRWSQKSVDFVMCCLKLLPLPHPALNPPSPLPTPPPPHTPSNILKGIYPKGKNVIIYTEVPFSFSFIWRIIQFCKI